MKAENRHHTIKWKKRRKNKGADRCGNPKCTICHSGKVLKIPSRQEMRQHEKDKSDLIRVREKL